MSRSVAVFYDPAGERHHLPTWPWGYAPDHLATRVVAEYCLPTSMHGECPPCYHDIPDGLLEAAA